jgi:two-component system chemotaxis response regulator CheY
LNPSTYTVLSIDDSRVIHAFLDRCLTLGGDEFRFVHAMSVREGLSILEKTSAGIAAVLLDWEMPEISGYDGLPMIQQKAPGVPVMVLSSKNVPEDIEAMLARGATEYMMKPFTPDILFEKLRALVGG